MSRYSVAYERQTGKLAPKFAERLTPLFDQMAAGKTVPPKGQQAVDLGFTAHTFNDSRVFPELYGYYQWVTTVYLQATVIHELSAKLIGMGFTSTNVFKTDLPQPITLNPWQVSQMTAYPLATGRAVVVENNGIFIWLAHRHPDWPLINQSGNDFNSAYVTLMQNLELRGLALTYLGDLDTAGIQIADQLFRYLKRTPIESFTALQTPARVSYWLALYGKNDSQRTRMGTVTTPVLKDEIQSIHTLGQFVEQEQLIAEYERLIPGWLGL